MHTKIKDDPEHKKEEVIHRIDKLDPNNNKNLPNKPIVKKNGKIKKDDGFEHRTSGDAAV